MDEHKQWSETLDYTIRIGSTPTFLYFDLYLYSAYAAHYVYVMYLRSISEGSGETTEDLEDSEKALYCVQPGDKTLGTRLVILQAYT